MMPTPDATWGDAQKAFEYHNAIGNLRRGRYMGLNEEQIMSKASNELILKPKQEVPAPPKSKGVDYRSRPLYVAYVSKGQTPKVVRGLVSKDEHNLYIGLEGKWYFGDDQYARDEIAETSLHQVPDADKIYIVNVFMSGRGIGPNGSRRITLEELLT